MIHPAHSHPPQEIPRAFPGSTPLHASCNQDRGLFFFRR
ncbi:hypothetical protein C4K20_2741 [Pseudomonas chlororaphis subsp. aurantiaca]|nr:hypothetical protein C4K20_2741 [Pseudomonas chlororaphis subsp. aurantiaca]AZD79326.1 hypothetical protein C4K15_2759 [Pseudomonas chlororaphis subsp. aurantiaca]